MKSLRREEVVTEILWSIQMEHCTKKKYRNTLNKDLLKTINDTLEIHRKPGQTDWGTTKSLMLII